MINIPKTLEQVLALSKADECVAIGWDSSTANVRWANNTTTTNGVTEGARLVVISIKDSSVGVVTSNYFPPERLEKIVRDSESACEGKPKAQDFVPLLEGSSTNGWEEPSSKTSVGVFEGFASDLGKLFERAGSNSTKLFGFANHEASTVYLATSSGIRRRHSQVEGTFELNAKSDDFKRSVWIGKSTKDFTDLDLADTFANLEQRLGWARKHIDLEPGRYEVILEPSAAADMLIYNYFSMSARDSDEGRTVFSKAGGGNRIGEKMFADGVSIYSDPFEPGLETEPFAVAPSSSSYSSVFDNGVDVKRTDWVADGALNKLITTRHWAAEKSTEVVPFVGNLILHSPEGPDTNEMIESTERGLLVTCLWYIRTVDPRTLLLTGLTRDGVYLIEKGKVKGAVNNFRFNMSPVAMLAQAREIGRSVPTLAREFGDYFTLAKIPPLRVEDWNMSSVSEAV